MNRRPAQQSSKQIFGLDLSVAIGLAAALVFFVASGVVAYLNFDALRIGNQRIVQTHQAIVSLDELLSQVQDAETGQRGYLLTGEEPYLAPYSTALKSIPAQLDEISRMTSINSGQDERLVVLRQYIDAKLAELAQTIDLRRAGQEAAALSLVRSDAGKLDMDAIRAQIASIAQEETRVRSLRLAEMDGAQQRALFSTLLSGILGLLLTAIIAFLVRRATATRRREEWLQSGEVGLGTAMMGDRPIEQLGNSILDFLASYTGAVAGAMFVSSGDNFLRASVHGVPGDAAIPSKIGPREGLLGRAADERRPIVVDDVPDGYLSFGSALGQDKPRHLAIVPGLVDEQVNSVLELGFLKPVDERIVALLDRASEAVAIAVRSAAYRGELQNLLEETQRQAEELQTQSEELRVSNEELEEQSRALKESQARLEQQQVELEQTNAQLEEQAQQLETQRDDLERVNISVELKARELEQASQYKSDFLANMSHELRTPLNSSLILAKLLADNPEENLTAEQVKYARTIQSSGNDLLNLINDILDLSKIEAGHVEIRPETVAVERLVGNLRQVFQPLAEDKHLAFAVEVAPAVARTIETDPQRLEQVLKNLLSNAIKFTESGRVTLSIQPGDDGTVSFAVTDTGIGIAREQQQSIFEAFQQADGTISRKYGGTGLGLSISRQLVRLLGGSIILNSEPGRGSTFTVKLPAGYDPARVAPREVATLVPASHPAPPAAASRTEVAPAARTIDDDRDAPASDGRRILLVIEDDNTFASIVRDLSREMGFQSIVAGTAEEALRLAKDYMPSAIVLDVGLPDQSGLAVLDRLKQDVRTRHIPIHVVSAGDHTESAYSLGAVGFANKPVTREQLVEVLQKLETKLAQRMHRVLVVEDDPVQREAVARLLGSGDVETVTASTAAECLALLEQQTFDCMVLDLSLPDASGYSLLETLSQEGAYSFPPVIVYTGRELSPVDEEKLRKYSRSIIIKGAKSPERLLDEVSLFLHQVISDLPDEQQKMIRKARHRDALLEGRRILVVEDDVRNVYALTNILEPRGASIRIARNGQEALDALTSAAASPDDRIDLVLMDVMMPVMDGLTATREIRRNPALRKLPIIALTAKAMPDDQQRCIEAGANDYMAKPLDVEKLLSLVRVWMPK
ncbi:response regulator [Devosia sp.]|uniref:response regulator n=1 Tax=Devosia sp. TaxID=1871048 RepID=UPI00086C6F2B|nr:response regulator [Devosia sp.]MBN9361393.1 response regulator [Devosia sp.]ODS85259.1 MAG: histidine kinase [Devosia sp. SCN 66-27]